MSDLRKNSYADEDLEKVIGEIEGYHDEAASVRAEAAGKCSQIAKRIVNAKKVAKSLGIPTGSLNSILKVRKLERQIETETGNVPDDEIELFEDMAGQFSWFRPEKGAPANQTPVEAAAAKRKAEIAAVSEREQAEGAAALDELSGDKVH